MCNEKKRALIAMSGGVDSSVAALLTRNAGYECVGCTMRLYDGDAQIVERENSCCSLDDVEDARAAGVRREHVGAGFHLALGRGSLLVQAGAHLGHVEQLPALGGGRR